MFKKFGFIEKVNLITFILCLGILAFIYRECTLRLSQTEQEILTQFNDIQSDLNLESQLITRFVSGGRSFAENFLKFEKRDDSEWLKYLQYDKQFKGYTLEGMSPQYKEQELGNLTSREPDLLTNAQKRIDVNMALELGEYLSSGLVSIKKTPWFYYTSKDFMYLAPYVPPEDYFFTKEITLQKEFYKNALPENNPNRQGFWTNVYIDEAGFGLMITYSEPVYLKDTFKGSISMDVTLDQFNAVLHKRFLPYGTFALYNRQMQILAEPNAVKSADQKITLASERIPQDLIEAAQNSKNSTELKHLGTHFVFYKDLPEFGATLVFFTSTQSILWRVLQNMLAVALAFFLCFVLIYYLRRFLIRDYLLQQKLIQNAKMAALGQMAAGMAHEINNPLAIISGRASLLQKALEKTEIDTNYIKESISKILKTSYRIEKIIHGLKSFSRNSESDPFEAVALKNLMQNTLELCLEAISNRKIKLIVAEVPNVFFSARESQLSQVLLNLLNNSMDAVENCAEKEIFISFKQENNLLYIYVRDSGPKIKPEVQQRLMEPFFTTKNPGAGTGLGLSISLGIMQEHNGRLYFLANDSQTCFVIEIPVLS